MTAPTTAIAYYRRSKEDDPSEPGVAQQKKAVADFVARKGYQLVGEWSDSDRSGWDQHVERPGFDDLVANLGRASIVVAWSQDRLTRDVGVWATFVTLAKRAGVERIEYVSGGDVDLAAPGDLFTGGIMAAVSEFYSNQLSANVKRGLRARAESGQANGGQRSFGFAVVETPGGKYEWKVSLDHDPEEVALIWEAARRVLDGETTRAIAIDWNRRGVETVSGTAWNGTVLRQILTNPKLAGKRRIGHYERGDEGQRVYVVDSIVDAAWEPILDEKTFDAVSARLATKNRRRRSGRDLQRWLSGVVVCGKCGKGLRGKYDKGKAIYACPLTTEGGCGGVTIQAAPLEARALELIVEEALANVEALRARLSADDFSDERSALDRERLALIERRDALAASYAEGEIDPTTLRAVSDKIAGKLVDVETRLREIEPTPVDDLGLLDLDVEKATPYELRDLARLVFADLTILPAWRTGRIAAGDDLLRGRVEYAIAV